MAQKHIEYKAPGIVASAKDALHRLMLKVGAIACGVALCDAYVLNGSGFAYIRERIAAHKVAVAEIPKAAPAEVVPDEPSPEPDVELEAQQILENRFRIPRAVWVTLARRESGFSPFAERFEPALMPRVKHLSPDPHEQRWFATSHNRFQALGLHLPRLNQKYGWSITPAEFAYDVRTGALVAGTILSECFRDDRVQRHKVTRDRLRALFACYNGTGSRADAYADAAMRELGQELLNDLELDIQPAQDEERPAKARKTEIAALRPEEGDPFIAEDRE